MRGIDLEVCEGEIFGFLGPNGAGKTTTIRCLLGLLRPTAGRVSAFGLDAVRDGVALRRRLAYVPGELRLPERVSGAEFIAGIGRLRGGFDRRLMGSWPSGSDSTSIARFATSRPATAELFVPLLLAVAAAREDS